MLVGKPVYENAFNKIERDLRAEEGIANELDYVEQTSWVLFLKYLHDLETERADRAELDGSDYAPIIDGEYRWDKWAAPKKDGEFDHNAARIGDDLIKVELDIALGNPPREGQKQKRRQKLHDGEPKEVDYTQGRRETRLEQRQKRVGGNNEARSQSHCTKVFWA